jgi:hypothetical protein
MDEQAMVLLHHSMSLKYEFESMSLNAEIGVAHSNSCPKPAALGSRFGVIPFLEF